MTEEKWAEIPEKDRFEKLVEYAEEFVVDNAKDVLVALRKRKDSEYEAEDCKTLLEKYKPICDDIEKITFEIILKRFCIQMQNYQAMPKAIDYLSYNDDEDSKSSKLNANNKLFKKIYNFYNNYQEWIPNDVKTKNINNDTTKESNFENDVKKGIETYHLELYKYLREKADDNDEVFFKEDSKLGRCLKVDEDEYYYFTNDEYKKLKDEYDNDNKNFSSLDNYVKNYPDKSFRYTSYFSRNEKNIRKQENWYYWEYNNAWYRYTRGIMDIFIQIKKLGIDNYVTYIKNIAGYLNDNNGYDLSKIQDYYNQINNKINNKINIDNKEELIDAFCKHIFYLGQTLTRDFFKELYCTKYIKDDVHIKECYKKCINSEEEDKDIFPKFIELCKGKYTPYYIDKLLWLCCTGYFYEDGITINKMTRRNFFKFIDNKIDQEK